MCEQTTMEFAKAYFHWFLLIQPAPFPETLINADPEFFLKSFMGKGSAGLSHFAPEAFAEYLRCFKAPRTAHGICEDYRASAGIDLDHERADLAAGRKIECDMLALWGARRSRKMLPAAGGVAAPCTQWRVTHFHAATTFLKRLPNNCSANCWSSCSTEQAYRTQANGTRLA